ncbi:MAG: FHA domain-containing protein [Armatimonadetes bacterium]|nr:FHA domain-containing protein [Armatimonadota bacterium]
MNQIPSDDDVLKEEEAVAEETVPEEASEEDAPGEEDGDGDQAAEETDDDAETALGPRLILVRNGVETDISFEINPPAVIGRFDPSVGPIEVDLGQVEEGSYVSRKHAKITLEDDVYEIEDLGSSNGTFILRDDFERIEKAVIVDGDQIALGNARFNFRL